MNTPALSLQQWEELNLALLEDLLAKERITHLTAEHVRDFIAVARYTAVAKQLELGFIQNHPSTSPPSHGVWPHPIPPAPPHPHAEAP